VFESGGGDEGVRDGERAAEPLAVGQDLCPAKCDGSGYWEDASAKIGFAFFLEPTLKVCSAFTGRKKSDLEVEFAKRDDAEEEIFARLCRNPGDDAWVREEARLFGDDVGVE
jgi:hypothetical protein